MRHLPGHSDGEPGFYHPMAHGKAAGMIDPAVGVYRLAIYRGAERSVFAFTKDALVNNYGSKQWEIRLQAQVGDIRMELRD